MFLTVTIILAYVFKLWVNGFRICLYVNPHRRVQTPAILSSGVRIICDYFESNRILNSLLQNVYRFMSLLYSLQLTRRYDFSFYPMC